MKIGVLTLVHAFNYGAVLQAYALTFFLRRSGFQAEIIDFIPHGQKKANNALLPPVSPSALKRDFLYPVTGAYQRKRRKGFTSFINKHIPLSAKKHILANTFSSVCETYDAVICGSDQIWNPRLVESDECFFLPHGKGFKRIAYAASIGKGYLSEYAIPEQIKYALDQFDFISVREKASLEKLESFSGRKAVTVVDPTLLLNGKDFLAIAAPTQFNRKYIFLYSVSPRKNTIQAAKYLSMRTKLPIITLFSGRPDFIWIRNKDLIPCGKIGPEEFLAYIRDAEYVVTDSFHGTVLSLQFQKVFFTISDEDEKGQLIQDERISSLCDLFQIKHRVIAAKDIKTASLFSDIDWSNVESNRQKAARESESFLLMALNTSEPRFFKRTIPADSVCPKEYCTGCMACINRCKMKAIEPELEIDGRILPHIDLSKCIHCDACRRVCPQVNQPYLHSVSKCYAAQSTNEEKNNSSSGGIGWELMKFIFSQGGDVFGAVIDNDLTIKHMCAETSEDVNRMRTSKYAACSMADIYHVISQKLKLQKRVLFIGTPCQVAGLRNFIGQDDNLICVDLICHGIPPMKYLCDHIKSKTKNADYYFFRGGKRDFIFRILYKNNIVYSRFWRNDEYYYSFNESISLQKNCYACAYAQSKRIGDLTIGDFWGLDRNDMQIKMHGRVSVILVNSEKGKKILDSITSNIRIEEKDFSKAQPGNPNLLAPSSFHPARGSFIRAYEKTGDFEAAFYSSNAQKEWKKDRLKNILPARAFRKLLRTLHMLNGN